MDIQRTSLLSLNNPIPEGPGTSLRLSFVPICLQAFTYVSVAAHAIRRPENVFFFKLVYYISCFEMPIHMRAELCQVVDLLLMEVCDWKPSRLNLVVSTETF